MSRTGENRRFLFLQGPHGPFLSTLGAALRRTGAKVWRVGFNPGDKTLWRGPGYLPYREKPADWPRAVRGILAGRGITDLLFYGSSRLIHAEARVAAEATGVRVHVLEEGYLRPYWVTYERDGANADSPAAKISLTRMAAALRDGAPGLVEAPDRWGDMRAHVFWGAVYHAALMAGGRGYPGYRAHRTPGVAAEFRLHLRRLLEMPYRDIGRRMATRRIALGGFPYHVVLMQLAHDANFRDNGPFPDQAGFLETVFRGFASGAPAHHHLVVKAHPLEDGREPLGPLIRRLTREVELEGRVHFLDGGKLARLLGGARSAVTVNSTSAEQALWRGLPLRAFGRAVYHRPEFVSDQPVSAFFADPRPPDRNAYLTYRAFLLATSQVPGGFYAQRSRAKLLRQLPDLILASESAADRLLEAGTPAAGPQHLKAVC